MRFFKDQIFKRQLVFNVKQDFIDPTLFKTVQSRFSDNLWISDYFSKTNFQFIT